MNNLTEILKTNKKKFVFYNDWKKDYFEIDKSNQVMLDNWGICDLREETEKIRIYSNGGYLEILNNGNYFITLDRSDYEYKKEELEELEKLLYDWCNGELFNLYNGWSSEANNIANKIMLHCSNDKNYMWEIINEYVQMLEESKLGLKGIKETLEERENKENV